MKIALFIPTLDGGGAQRVALNLCEGFKKQSIEVDLILVRKDGALSNSIPKGVNIKVLNSSRTLFAIPALAKLIDENNYDRLISFMGYVNICAIAATLLSSNSLKVIITEHSTISREKDKYRLRKIFQRFLMKFLYPKAYKIIAVSEGAADILKSSLNLRRHVNVIYNPIVNDALNIENRKVPKHAWFKDEVPVVLAVGRLVSLKDYPTLISAIAQINKKKTCRLIILGEGEERNKLQELVNKVGISDNVSMPGFIEEVYDYMYASDIFVLSSISEGFGNVIVEALACGTPIVSSDCPHGPSEILKGGKFGKLIPVNNVNALANAIDESLKNPISNKQDRIKRANDFCVNKVSLQYASL